MKGLLLPPSPMPEPPAHDPAAGSPPLAAPVSSADFHWQGFFQRAQEPLFLLNRRRRILFVNRAWERLTGLLAAQARGLVCTRSRSAESSVWEDVLSHALYPPPEVLQGNCCR